MIKKFICSVRDSGESHAGADFFVVADLEVMAKQRYGIKIYIYSI
jgi:hypothetical protein